MATDVTSTVEARLTTLEGEVADLKRRAAERPAEGDWLAKSMGVLRDYPEFDEAAALGRALCNTIPPEASGP